MSEEAFAEQRKQLVQAMNLHSKSVEKAFLSVKREQFFPAELKQYAYADSAFPIGFGQTISQPSTIAIMLEMLSVKPGDRLLEVGGGSGYVAALLSELVGVKGKVFAIELVCELQQRATKTLTQLGYKKVEMRCGDGTLGWREEAPFDCILISAACRQVPKPLTEQLKEGGKLVAPVGGRFTQEMVLLQKEKGKSVEKDSKCCFVFVPLKGKFGN